MPDANTPLQTPAQVFPIRITLRMTAPAQFHAHHAAILYALIADVPPAAGDHPGGIPDGVLLDAPEQCRLRLAKDDRYTFGASLLFPDRSGAADCLEMLSRGLGRIGHERPRGRKALSGNFEIAELEHLAGTGSDGKPNPIDPTVFCDEQKATRELKELTLNFLSPLRWERPKPDQAEGATSFDHRYFNAEVFVRRTIDRVRSLGYVLSQDDVGRSDVSLVSNQLIWLDFSYGSHQSTRTARKPMGGAVGRVVFRLKNPMLADALVLGQYLRVGRFTRFGFGVYRIAELGVSPYRAKRAVRLIDLAFAHPIVDRNSERYDTVSGQVSLLARQIREGNYRPLPAVRLLVGGDRPRVLTIPAPVDRVLQRAVFDLIAPALDLFFEESSVAYRKGLSRESAARRIRDAYRAGYCWGLRSDFHSFFDSIDHELLRRRLDAYLADESLVELVMVWVRSGSIQPGRGLPTGSVLSPLLANLFLDQFDEHVSREGVRLVRYADDFLLLFRDESTASQVFESARTQAEQLRLALNEDKTHLLDLTLPFNFLGFRFHRDEQWQMSPSGALKHLDELGWEEAPRGAAHSGDDRRLPGELQSEPIPEAIHANVIVGPGVTWMGVEGRDLVFRCSSDQPAQRIACRRAGTLIVLGPPTIDRSVFSSAHCESVDLLISDAVGGHLRSLLRDSPLESALLLKAQVAANNDCAKRLDIARRLVHAKLRNHAALARCYPRRQGGASEVPGALEELAGKSLTAASIEELMGLEGAGAARWYAEFGDRLDGRFSFTHRVAPAADDPINVMLNFAQTVLHRLIELVLTREGFAPSLGFLHEVRAGHNALASDFQEIFRHLMDRAVIESSAVLLPSQFHTDRDGTHPLRIDPGAVRVFLAIVFRTIARSCGQVGRDAPRPYRQILASNVRSLHRHLLDPSVPFEVFVHP
jgi:CRISPR-associated protein Cas1